MTEPLDITNDAIQKRTWLKSLYKDDYYPNIVLDMVKIVLINVCKDIEKIKPVTLDDLYSITNRGVQQINDLEDEFDKHGSEIETIAREEICEEFYFIAKSYGFAHADLEELVRDRDW